MRITRSESMNRRTDSAELDEFGRFAEPALLILISLADGPKHGYAITEDIAAFAGVRFGPGSLYGAIARLESRRMIRSPCGRGPPQSCTSLLPRARRRSAQDSRVCSPLPQWDENGWSTRDLVAEVVSARLAATIRSGAHSVACDPIDVAWHGDRSHCGRDRCLDTSTVVHGCAGQAGCERRGKDAGEDDAAQVRGLRPHCHVRRRLEERRRHS